MRNELGSRGARLIRAEMTEDPPHQELVGAEPQEAKLVPRERTVFDLKPFRIRLDDGLVRLDAIVPAGCPFEVAEGLVRSGAVPGRVYSELILASPPRLRSAWKRIRAAQEGGAHG